MSPVSSAAPKCLDALKSMSLPNHLEAPPRSGSTIRFWTPGCASGEETYSLAIALLEFLGDKAAGNIPSRFFGTGCQRSQYRPGPAAASIPKIFRGTFPPNACAASSPRSITATASANPFAIFASSPSTTSSVDPPFSQMDVISLPQSPHLPGTHPANQSHLPLPLRFPPYRLSRRSAIPKPSGPLANLFTSVDRSQKIFLKKLHRLPPVRQLFHSASFPAESRGTRCHPPPCTPRSTPGIIVEAQKEFDRRLLQSIRSRHCLHQ